jgi:chemotaxis protein methyltransferase CheR
MAWSDPAFEEVVTLLGIRSGLAFPENRHDSAEQGIRRAMRRAGVGSLHGYRELVETDAGALDDLLVELTVGETYFFREPQHFEFIRREVLPAHRRRCGEDHLLRAWSAGCASGEEAYSLAIVIEKELAERAHVLATDVSRAALAKARRAAYGSWSLRGDAAAAASPYLTRQGKQFLVADKIRRRVTFNYLNLALDVYPSFATGTWALDLILCRNVLIYFNRETVRKVARRLFDALAPGGWLITASSDPPLNGEAPYETVVTEWGVFYRRGNEAEALAAEARPLSRPAAAAARTIAVPDQELGVRDQGSGIGHGAVVGVPPLAGSSRDSEASLTPALRALTRVEDAVAAAVQQVRMLANGDTARASQACSVATAQHPLSTELHFLHAVLLLELGQDEEAAQAARRVLYLDRGLAVAHFTLASILRRRGDVRGARRAYRNARALCRARPEPEVVPLSDGEPAGRLAAAAEAQLALLEGPEGAVS